MIFLFVLFVLDKMFMGKDQCSGIVNKVKRKKNEKWNNTSSSDFRMYSKAMVTKTVNMSDSTYYKELELEAL